MAKVSCSPVFWSLTARARHLLGCNVLTSMRACPGAYCKWTALPHPFPQDKFSMRESLPGSPRPPLTQLGIRLPGSLWSEVAPLFGKAQQMPCATSPSSGV